MATFMPWACCIESLARLCLCSTWAFVPAVVSGSFMVVCAVANATLGAALVHVAAVAVGFEDTCELAASPGRFD